MKVLKILIFSLLAFSASAQFGTKVTVTMSGGGGDAQTIYNTSDTVADDRMVEVKNGKSLGFGILPGFPNISTTGNKGLFISPGYYDEVSLYNTYGGYSSFYTSYGNYNYSGATKNGANVHGYHIAGFGYIPGYSDSPFAAMEAKGYVSTVRVILDTAGLRLNSNSPLFDYRFPFSQYGENPGDTSIWYVASNGEAGWLDKSDFGGGGGSGTIYRAVINVQHLGVVGDGVTNVTTLLQSIIDTTSAILYFPKGTYIAHITTAQGTHLIGEQSTQIRWTDNAYPTIQTGGTTTLEGIYFYNTHATGVSINSSSFSLRANDCTFSAWKNNASVGVNETGIFQGCNFIINDAGGTSIGTACWSPNARFEDCNFTGTFGADAQDATFVNCYFKNEQWAVHMPLGAISNTGTATGYLGSAVFINCHIEGGITSSYAMGLGNAAQPMLYNCTLKHSLTGIYARTQSFFTARDCHFQATSITGGAAPVKFAKYATAPQIAIGLTDSGNSYLSGCTLEGGQYSLIVPSASGKGSVELSSCFLNTTLIRPETSAGTADVFNTAYIYVNLYTDGARNLTDTKTGASAFTGGATNVYSPSYTPKGITYCDGISTTTTTADIRLTRFYRNPDRFYDNGYILVIRGGSDTQKIRIKNGYYAPEATLVVNTSGADLELGANQVATYVYFTNTWYQLGGLGPDASITNEGQLQVGAGGANSSTLISNTSGSGTPTFSGGNNIRITEVTGPSGTITIQSDAYMTNGVWVDDPDLNGDVLISLTMPDNTYTAVATIEGTAQYYCTVHTKTATSFIVRILGITGSPPAGTITINWMTRDYTPL